MINDVRQSTFQSVRVEPSGQPDVGGQLPQTRAGRPTSAEARADCSPRVGPRGSAAAPSGRRPGRSPTLWRVQAPVGLSFPHGSVKQAFREAEPIVRPPLTSLAGQPGAAAQAPPWRRPNNGSFSSYSRSTQRERRQTMQGTENITGFAISTAFLRYWLLLISKVD